MSAGMAEVIAAHSMYDVDRDGMMRCWLNDCGWRHARDGNPFELRAAHVAEELAKAGYGKLPEPDEEYDFGDPESVIVAGSFVRAFVQTPAPLAAALADPEGRALVQAIHDRKAEA